MPRAATMDDLDTSSIYLSFVCPACQSINHAHLDGVGFGFELDLDITEAGHCRPWIELSCMVCGRYLEKHLDLRGEYDEQSALH